MTVFLQGDAGEVQKEEESFSGGHCEPGYLLRALRFGKIHVCPHAPFLLPHQASPLHLGSFWALWFSFCYGIGMGHELPAL